MQEGGELVRIAQEMCDMGVMIMRNHYMLTAGRIETEWSGLGHASGSAQHLWQNR